MVASTSTCMDSAPGRTTRLIRSTNADRSPVLAWTSASPSGEHSSMITTAWPSTSRQGQTCTSPSPEGSYSPSVRRSRPKVQRTWLRPVMKTVVTA